MSFVILFAAALWAGIQNALAGGGSFITLPSLMLTGMDARAANITSTVALFPAQLATGWTGRRQVSGAASLSFRALVIISLAGGALGALLLLKTPPQFFARLVPWLVLFAGVMNASAVAIFVFSPEVRWFAAAIASAGAIIGGVIGGLMLQKVNERALRMVVVAIGVALTVGLFLHSP